MTGVFRHRFRARPRRWMPFSVSDEIALPALSDFTSEAGNLDGDTLSQSAHKWATARGSGWEQDSGLAKPIGTDAVVIVTDMPDTPDIAVQGTLQSTGSAAQAGLVARYVDDDNYYYAHVDSSFRVDLLKRTSGSDTLVQAGTTVVSQTAVIKFVVRGSAPNILEVYEDGILVEDDSETDASLLTGKAGMIRDGTLTSTRWGDFSATVFVPAVGDDILPRGLSAVRHGVVASPWGLHPIEEGITT